MKDYQLYLEKITNALSRAGISYPAPTFTDYEGMWSYVEGLSSFLELNSQLQKSGAGVVLMGLEESTTFKSYWNSEFYQEFQERKLLESKISSNLNESEMESDGGEIGVSESAEFPLQTGESERKTNALENSLVVGSVIGSVLGSSFVSGTNRSELEAKSPLKDTPSSLEGYDSSNIVFIADDSDESEESEDGLRYDEDGFVIEDDYESSEEVVPTDSQPTLGGYDSSNIVFVDDDSEDEEEESDDSDGLQYDEDGFVILNDEDSESEEAEDSEYTYDEYGNKYDKDGFIVLEDDDEDESDEEIESSEDEYTYDEYGNKFDKDGFFVEDEDEEEGDSSDSPSQGVISYEPDGSYYDEYGNHFDSDGFIIGDDDNSEEVEDESVEVSSDGSYYDEYGNHFDADGFLIDDDDDSEEDSEELEESQSNVEPDGSYYDEYGNHFDADGFLIDDEDENEDNDEEQSGGDTQLNVLPDGSYYDEYGNHFDSEGFLIEDEEEEENEVPTQTLGVSSPSQQEIPVHREVVSPLPKPKIIMPKEVQTADKIMSLFGGMESKLRKKVQDVKKPKN